MPPFRAKTIVRREPVGNILMIGMILIQVPLDMPINVDMTVEELNALVLVMVDVYFIKDIKKDLNTKDLWLKILSTSVMTIMRD